MTITSLPAYGNIIFNYVENGEIKLKTFGGLPYAITSSTISTLIPELQSVLKGSNLYCGANANGTSHSPHKASSTGDIEMPNGIVILGYQIGICFYVFGNGSITVS